MSGSLQQESKAFEVFLKKHLEQAFWSNTDLKNKNYAGLSELKASVEYSLFSGGKRFRPMLTLLVAKSLDRDIENCLGFAAAVEMVHTYSLIHDDLPCMDDDNERRGLPTNHIKFNEATALLAGDTLLTEAFKILSESYKDQSQVCVELGSILSKAIGFCGMIGGQVLDIQALNDGQTNATTLNDIHKLKTAALIAVSIEGAAVIAQVSQKQRENLKSFGQFIGEAFQVADDILDYDPESPEGSSYVTLHGLEATKKYLNELTDKAIDLIEFIKDPELKNLCIFNRERTH